MGLNDQDGVNAVLCTRSASAWRASVQITPAVSMTVSQSVWMGHTFAPQKLILGIYLPFRLQEESIEAKPEDISLSHWFLSLSDDGRDLPARLPCLVSWNVRPFRKICFLQFFTVLVKLCWHWHTVSQLFFFNDYFYLHVCLYCMSVKKYV